MLTQRKGIWATYSISIETKSELVHQLTFGHGSTELISFVRYWFVVPAEKKIRFYIVETVFITNREISSAIWISLRPNGNGDDSQFSSFSFEVVFLVFFIFQIKYLRTCSFRMNRVNRGNTHSNGSRQKVLQDVKVNWVNVDNEKNN